MVFPDIWMMHLLSFPISLELKGRTLTATLTEAVAMVPVGGVGWGGGDGAVCQRPAQHT